MGVGTKQPDFAEFYRGAADECLRAVLVSIGNQDTAQELVDEAFARAWASWHTVRTHPAPKAWVVRTALNTGISGGDAAAGRYPYPTQPGSRTCPPPARRRPAWPTRRSWRR
jgi:DNA-directed RNA polymerase specialized sigma24 family protein